MELIKIFEKYNTKKKCVLYLEQKRWNNQPVCPYCDSTRNSSKQKELRHKCHTCGRSFSMSVETIFESTKLPLTKWFAAICLI